MYQNPHLFNIVIAAGEQETLCGVGAPPEEGGDAGADGVDPQGHDQHEGLHICTAGFNRVKPGYCHPSLTTFTLRNKICPREDDILTHLLRIFFHSSASSAQGGK
jgi:hypothetical protein